MIRHASVYDPPSEEAAGLRVLIMRYWPRGIRRDKIDVWLKDAAPSAALLKAFQQSELSWETFEQHYRSEMLGRPGVIERVRELEREHGTLTLLCHERMPPSQHCHRVILADLLAGG